AAPALIAQWGRAASGGEVRRAGPPQASTAPSGGSAVREATSVGASLALPHRLLRSPAVIFNRKDALQDAFLAQHFNLRDALYPRHFVPAVEAFELALELGMGWGMVPDLLLAARTHRPALQEVWADHPVDVVLYWQHWAREPVAAQRLTQAIRQAARERLLQL
ncbi:MAG: hypothetical protein ACREBY_14415, partial [Polaromonas sp.]